MSSAAQIIREVSARDFIVGQRPLYLIVGKGTVQGTEHEWYWYQGEPGADIHSPKHRGWVRTEAEATRYGGEEAEYHMAALSKDIEELLAKNPSLRATMIHDLRLKPVELAEAVDPREFIDQLGDFDYALVMIRKNGQPKLWHDGVHWNVDASRARGFDRKTADKLAARYAADNEHWQVLVEPLPLSKPPPDLPAHLREAVDPRDFIEKEPGEMYCAAVNWWKPSPEYPRYLSHHSNNWTNDLKDVRRMTWDEANDIVARCNARYKEYGYNYSVEPLPPEALKNDPPPLKKPLPSDLADLTAGVTEAQEPKDFISDVPYPNYVITGKTVDGMKLYWDGYRWSPEAKQAAKYAWRSGQAAIERINRRWDGMDVVVMRPDLQLEPVIPANESVDPKEFIDSQASPSFVVIAQRVYARGAGERIYWTGVNWGRVRQAKRMSYEDAAHQAELFSKVQQYRNYKFSVETVPGVEEAAIDPKEFIDQTKVNYIIVRVPVEGSELGPDYFYSYDNIGDVVHWEQSRDKAFVMPGDVAEKMRSALAGAMPDDKFVIEPVESRTTVPASNLRLSRDADGTLRDNWGRKIKEDMRESADAKDFILDQNPRYIVYGIHHQRGGRVQYFHSIGSSVHGTTAATFVDRREDAMRMSGPEAEALAKDCQQKSFIDSETGLPGITYHIEPAVLPKDFSREDVAEAMSADEIAKEADKAEPPSEAQADAGNYAKGHVRIHGLDISIENAKGSVRSGDDNGRHWEVTLPAHYGYIKGTEGKDKDHIDVYIGEHPNAFIVYVVNQATRKGDFDEHKLLLGFQSKDEAVAAYDGGFEGDLGPKLRKEVIAVTVPQLKLWLEKGEHKKPFVKVDEAVDPKAFIDAMPDKRFTVVCATFYGRPVLHKLWRSRLGGFTSNPQHIALYTLGEADAIQQELHHKNIHNDYKVEEAPPEAKLGEAQDPKEFIDQQNIPTGEDEFTKSYIAAALWSTTDNRDDTGGLPLESNYDESNFDPATLFKMRMDCQRFQEQNAEALALADYNSAQWSNEALAGHDFWLTRNGNGTGFWDRDNLPEEVRGALNQAARAYGGFDLSVEFFNHDEDGHLLQDAEGKWMYDAERDVIYGYPLDPVTRLREDEGAKDFIQNVEPSYVVVLRDERDDIRYLNINDKGTREFWAPTESAEKVRTATRFTAAAAERELARMREMMPRLTLWVEVERDHLPDQPVIDTDLPYPPDADVWPYPPVDESVEPKEFIDQQETPELCRYCGKNWREPSSVTRCYVQKGANDPGSDYYIYGHYSAAGDFEPDETPAISLTNYDLYDDSDSCDGCGRSTMQVNEAEEPKEFIDQQPDPKAFCVAMWFPNSSGGWWTYLLPDGGWSDEHIRAQPYTWSEAQAMKAKREHDFPGANYSVQPLVFLPHGRLHGTKYLEALDAILPDPKEFIDDVPDKRYVIRLRYQVSGGTAIRFYCDRSNPSEGYWQTSIANAKRMTYAQAQKWLDIWQKHKQPGTVFDIYPTITEAEDPKEFIRWVDRPAFHVAATKGDDVRFWRSSAGRYILNLQSPDAGHWVDDINLASILNPDDAQIIVNARQPDMTVLGWTLDLWPYVPMDESVDPKDFIEQLPDNQFIVRYDYEGRRGMVQTRYFRWTDGLHTTSHWTTDKAEASPMTYETAEKVIYTWIPQTQATKAHIIPRMEGVDPKDFIEQQPKSEHASYCLAMFIRRGISNAYTKDKDISGFADFKGEVVPKPVPMTYAEAKEVGSKLDAKYGPALLWIIQSLSRYESIDPKDFIEQQPPSRYYVVIPVRSGYLYFCGNKDINLVSSWEENPTGCSAMPYDEAKLRLHELLTQVPKAQYMKPMLIPAVVKFMRPRKQQEAQTEDPKEFIVDNPYPVEFPVGATVKIKRLEGSTYYDGHKAKITARRVNADFEPVYTVKVAFWPNLCGEYSHDEIELVHECQRDEFDDLLMESKDDWLRIASVVALWQGKVALVKSKKYGVWTLPGGHCHEDETAWHAAARECNEECSVKINPDKLVFAGFVQRSKRKVDSVFVYELKKEQKLKAGSDAADVRWASVDSLPKLGMGHNAIIKKALKVWRTPPEQRGQLIVFEGVDGSGKSTQSERTVEWLTKHGYPFVTTKWNSSPIVSKAIKKAKKRKQLGGVLYHLLHAADMLHRYQYEIAPALARNFVVVSDRYWYTGIVRDKVRGVKPEMQKALYAKLRKPDVTFFCSVNPSVAVARLVKAGRLTWYGCGMDLGFAPSKEENALEYEKRMSRAYKLALPRHVCLNMSRKVDNIFHDVKAKLERTLSRHYFHGENLRETAEGVVGCLLETDDVRDFIVSQPIRYPHMDWQAVFYDGLDPETTAHAKVLYPGCTYADAYAQARQYGLRHWPNANMLLRPMRFDLKTVAEAIPVYADGMRLDPASNFKDFLANENVLYWVTRRGKREGDAPEYFRQNRPEDDWTWFSWYTDPAEATTMRRSAADALVNRLRGEYPDDIIQVEVAINESAEPKDFIEQVPEPLNYWEMRLYADGVPLGIGQLYYDTYANAFDDATRILAMHRAAGRNYQMQFRLKPSPQQEAVDPRDFIEQVPSFREGMRVQSLISVKDVCDKGDTGVVTEYPWGTAHNFAVVTFDHPRYESNQYAFRSDEVVELVGEAVDPKEFIDQQPVMRDWKVVYRDKEGVGITSMTLRTMTQQAALIIARRHRKDWPDLAHMEVAPVEDFMDDDLVRHSDDLVVEAVDPKEFIEGEFSPNELAAKMEAKGWRHVWVTSGGYRDNTWMMSIDSALTDTQTHDDRLWKPEANRAKRDAVAVVNEYFKVRPVKTEFYEGGTDGDFLFYFTLPPDIQMPLDVPVVESVDTKDFILNEPQPEKGKYYYLCGATNRASYYWKQPSWERQEQGRWLRSPRNATVYDYDGIVKELSDWKNFYTPTTHIYVFIEEAPAPPPEPTLEAVDAKSFILDEPQPDYLVTQTIDGDRVYYLWSIKSGHFCLEPEDALRMSPAEAERRADEFTQQNSQPNVEYGTTMAPQIAEAVDPKDFIGQSEPTYVVSYTNPNGEKFYYHYEGSGYVTVATPAEADRFSYGEARFLILRMLNFIGREPSGKFAVEPFVGESVDPKEFIGQTRVVYGVKRDDEGRISWLGWDGMMVADPAKAKPFSYDKAANAAEHLTHYYGTSVGEFKPEVLPVMVPEAVDPKDFILASEPDTFRVGGTDAEDGVRRFLTTTHAHCDGWTSDPTKATLMTREEADHEIADLRRVMGKVGNWMTDFVAEPVDNTTGKEGYWRWLQHEAVEDQGLLPLGIYQQEVMPFYGERSYPPPPPKLPKMEPSRAKDIIMGMGDDMYRVKLTRTRFKPGSVAYWGKAGWTEQPRNAVGLTFEQAQGIVGDGNHSEGYLSMELAPVHSQPGDGVRENVDPKDFLMDQPAQVALDNFVYDKAAFRKFCLSLGFKVVYMHQRRDGGWSAVMNERTGRNLNYEDEQLFKDYFVRWLQQRWGKTPDDYYVADQVHVQCWVDMHTQQLVVNVDNNTGGRLYRRIGDSLEAPDPKEFIEQQPAIDSGRDGGLVRAKCPKCGRINIKRKTWSDSDAPSKCVRCDDFDCNALIPQWSFYRVLSVESLLSKPDATDPKEFISQQPGVRWSYKINYRGQLSREKGEPYGFTLYYWVDDYEGKTDIYKSWNVSGASLKPGQHYDIEQFAKEVSNWIWAEEAAHPIPPLPARVDRYAPKDKAVRAANHAYEWLQARLHERGYQSLQEWLQAWLVQQDDQRRQAPQQEAVDPKEFIEKEPGPQYVIVTSDRAYYYRFGSPARVEFHRDTYPNHTKPSFARGVIDADDIEFELENARQYDATAQAEVYDPAKGYQAEAVDTKGFIADVDQPVYLIKYTRLDRVEYLGMGRWAMSAYVLVPKEQATGFSYDEAKTVVANLQKNSTLSGKFSIEPYVADLAVESVDPKDFISELPDYTANNFIVVWRKPGKPVRYWGHNQMWNKSVSYAKRMTRGQAERLMKNLVLVLNGPDRPYLSISEPTLESVDPKEFIDQTSEPFEVKIEARAGGALDVPSAWYWFIVFYKGERIWERDLPHDMSRPQAQAQAQHICNQLNELHAVHPFKRNPAITDAFTDFADWWQTNRQPMGESLDPKDFILDQPEAKFTFRVEPYDLREMREAGQSPIGYTVIWTGHAIYDHPLPEHWSMDRVYKYCAKLESFMEHRNVIDPIEPVTKTAEMSVYDYWEAKEQQFFAWWDRQKEHIRSRHGLHLDMAESIDPKDFIGGEPPVELPRERFSPVKPGDGFNAPLRVVLKRSYGPTGEWVTRLENMQSGGEFYGHYFNQHRVGFEPGKNDDEVDKANYADALEDFKKRCANLQVDWTQSDLGESVDPKEFINKQPQMPFHITAWPEGDGYEVRWNTQNYRQQGKENRDLPQWAIVQGRSVPVGTTPQELQQIINLVYDFLLSQPVPFSPVPGLDEDGLRQAFRRWWLDRPQADRVKLYQAVDALRPNDMPRLAQHWLGAGWNRNVREAIDPKDFIEQQPTVDPIINMRRQARGYLIWLYGFGEAGEAELEAINKANSWAEIEDIVKARVGDSWNSEDEVSLTGMDFTEVEDEGGATAVDEALSRKTYCGNCVDSFDRNGQCVNGLFRDAADFAAQEQAMRDEDQELRDEARVSRAGFKRLAALPADLDNPDVVDYYKLPGGVYVALNIETGIHHFFADAGIVDENVDPKEFIDSLSTVEDVAIKYGFTKSDERSYPEEQGNLKGFRLVEFKGKMNLPWGDELPVLLTYTITSPSTVVYKMARNQELQRQFNEDHRVFIKVAGRQRRFVRPTGQDAAEGLNKRLDALQSILSRMRSRNPAQLDRVLRAGLYKKQ